MDQADYEALAAFRLEITRFLEFSRRLLAEEGVPPAQYQAMLAIRAHRGAAYSISHLAADLCVRVQSAVELVGRMRDAGLVKRAPAREGRRRILLTLTPRGETLLPGLAERDLRDLRARMPAFSAALARFPLDATT